MSGSTRAPREHAEHHEPGPPLVVASVLADANEADQPSGQLVIRRCLDIATALVLLVVLAVPAVLISIIVKATSKGPILFKQDRVGRNGVDFTVLKFRTMRDGTHDEVLADDSLLTAYRNNDFKLRPDDPRITKIGRLLRKTSLDEVPQLVNVFRGEMSVVGIRPLLAEELAMRPSYDQELYRSLRPGMTGLWQVEGRSSVVKEDRLQLDRKYVEEWSMWNDIKILTRTPFAVLRIGHAH